MKKIILLLMFLLCFSIKAEAGLIVVDTLSDDASVDNLNKAFNTIKNAFNGNIESANIAADTIMESDLADEINPRVRDDELFGDITITGMLPATSATLTSDISAGTSYVSGYRVVTSATSKTYTASKDTWVYIDKNGAFQYIEVANGAAEPTTPANSLKLATVVTDGTAITSVTDRRTTTFSVTSPEDYYISGMTTESADTETVSIDVGCIKVGTTFITKTTKTGLRLSTASDWWDGVQDSYAGGANWCYIGIKSDNTLKFLGNNPPNRSDVSGNSAGRLLYYYDGTNYWRVIGETYVNTSNLFNHILQQGNRLMWAEPVSVTTAVSNMVWTGATAVRMPSKERIGLFGVRSSETGGGPGQTGIWIRPNGTAYAGSATDIQNGLVADTAGVTNMEIGGQLWMFTDSSQQINYMNDTDDDETDIDILGWITYLRD